MSFWGLFRACFGARCPSGFCAVLLAASGRTRQQHERLLGVLGLFKQLGGTKTTVKYSAFAAFLKSTRTADAQPLGARLGALVCLLFASWGAL